ncbi:MAG: hypothetical protein CL424_18980 [Acidimicrobiaceae bacterium]|nr:hypothetical protein [Acidimicrobiaceae bacterium]
MSSPLTKAARSATAPFRNFFNDHFEMVKHEVRTANAAGSHSDDRSEALRLVVADLEAGLVEQSLHHARALVAAQESLEQLSARIDELQRAVDRLGDVVAASVSVDEPA